MLPSKIVRAIDRQEGNLLKRGEPPNSRFSTLRQRHLWSRYHFVNGVGTAIIQNAATGNVPFVQPGVYQTFVVDPGTNGQGLPGGFRLSQLDSNFIGSGRIPDQQNLSIWEIGVSVQSQREDVVLDAPTLRGAGQIQPDDVDKILTEGILRIKYITQEVSLGHLADFGEPGGPSFTQPSLLDYAATGVVVAGPPAGGTGGLSVGSVVDQPWSLAQPRLSTNGGSATANPGARIRLDVPIFLPQKTQFEFQLAFRRGFFLRSLENGGTAGFVIRVDLWCAESYRPNS